MADLVERMEQLRVERVAALTELDKIISEMQVVAAKADRAGHSGYRIAKLLGITHRTVYMWLKG